MKRYLESEIKADLARKIVLLSGPRQAGKTTLSRQLIDPYEYFNCDVAADRLALNEQAWRRDVPLVIFDELHKVSEWKRWLKGVYDSEGVDPAILVTGSAQMDTYRKVGDSLAGRFFSYRMHPLDLKEAREHCKWTIEESFKRLWNCSGFPEPFLSGEVRDYKRWQRSHLDIILRQDLLDLYSISDIKSLETLVALLKKRIGSSVSYANLARGLQKDATTIKRWLGLLESLYVIFPVTPYHRNVARSMLKEPKYYFYDWVYAEEDGARLENMVASALLKEIHFLEDTQGIRGSLHYLRTKDGKELDFLVCLDDKPTHVIEVKLSDAKLSAHFKFFAEFFKAPQQIQLVKNLSRAKSYPDGVKIKNLIEWLSQLSLCAK